MYARASLPAEPASASAARRFLRNTLADWHLEEYTDAACLLASELVTNAVLHAGSVSDIAVYYQDRVLRVEVADESVQQVRPRSYSAEAGTGRGLLLVQAIAVDWGHTPAVGGKVVWFELTTESLTRGEQG